MLKVDIIKCKTKGTTSTFLFASAMIIENTTAENINVFKKLNINQLCLAKDDFYFNELFYI